MNTYLDLTLTITSEWHSGAGKEAGAYADTLIVRDHNGLPYFPGKSLKGLLRQAFTTAVDNHWFTEHPGLVGHLFGVEGRNGSADSGMLQVSSAHLSAAEMNYLNSSPDAKKFLTRSLFFNAIDGVTGVAKEGSLRSIEVAVPMRILAQLEINPHHPHYKGYSLEQIKTWIGQCLPLICELGGYRNRGLGRVEMSLKGAE